MNRILKVFGDGHLLSSLEKVDVDNLILHCLSLLNLNMMLGKQQE